MNTENKVISNEDEEIEGLKKIRRYFGQQDMTTFEHWAYQFLNSIIEESPIPSVADEKKWTDEDMNDCYLAGCNFPITNLQFKQYIESLNKIT